MAFLAPAIGFLASGAGAATLAGASLALTAYGAYESNRVARKNARQEVAYADEEATQLEMRAADTLAAGSYNAAKLRDRVQKILGNARAAQAAGNNDTTAGSNAEINASIRREASIDELLAMREAADDAAKDKFQAKVTRQTGQRQAANYRAQGKAALIGGASRLLSGAVDWNEKYG